MGFRCVGRAADGGGAITARRAQPVRGRARVGRTPPTVSRGRANLENRECAACARPDAPGVQRSSSRPSCATSSAHSSADPRRSDLPAGCGPRVGWRDLIEYRTGVRYHEDHVWRILRSARYVARPGLSTDLRAENSAMPVSMTTAQREASPTSRPVSVETPPPNESAYVDSVPAQPVNGVEIRAAGP